MKDKVKAWTTSWFIWRLRRSSTASYIQGTRIRHRTFR